MPDYYSLALRSGTRKDFLLKTDTSLTQEQMERLQSRACFDLLKQKAPKETLSFKDLDGQLAGVTDLDQKPVFLQKITLPGLNNPIVVRRSYCYFWKQLVSSTLSYIPVVNVIWILFISPFIALYNYYKQNGVLKGQWESYLGRMQLTSYTHYLDALRQFTRLIPAEQPALKIQLTQAIERSEKASTAESVDALYELARQYSSAIVQSDAEFILPVGLRSEDGFIPLLAVIKKEGGSVRIDINSWGGLKTENLERSYHLKMGENTAEDALQDALMGLLLPLLPTEARKKVTLGNCSARIDLHNLKHYEDASQSGSPAPLPLAVSDGARLHEILILSGFHPAHKQQAPPKGKLLPQFIESCLLYTHPEVCSVSKIMLFLSFFQEGAACFKEAFSSLSANEQSEGLSLLGNTLKQLKLHADKFLKKKEEIDAFEAAIQPVFDELAQLKTLKGSASSSKTVCNTQTRIAHFSELRGKQGSEQGAEQVQTPLITEFPELAGVSFETITEATIQALTQSNKVIDKLIDQKQYVRARALAFELMRRMPVAQEGREGVLAPLYNNAKLIDAFSEQAALIAKHFWESSLRLNLKTLEPPAVFQMIKLQALIVKLIRMTATNGSGDLARFLGRMTLDMDEMRHLLFFHPHQRWGLHPNEEKEWLPLIRYLYSKENEGRSTRFDTMVNYYPEAWTDHADFLKNTPTFKPIRRTGAQQVIADQLIDLRRVQMMMTCLLKPDYCLSKHYDAGKAGQVIGLLWLDGMQEQAKKEGATPETLKKKVLEIKLRDVGKELASMKRLELATDDFVTEKGPIIKIVGTNAFSGSGVAYLPTGIGLPYEMEKRYATHKSEENSTDLAGSPAETHAFLSRDDGHDVVVENETQFTGLAPVQGFTEQSHLLMQLQQDPKDQISQVQRTLLSMLKIDQTHYRFNQSDFIEVRGADRPEGVAPTSTFEALNLIAKQPHLLLNAPARQTLELVLSVPFALQRALRENPHFFRTYSQTLNQLIDRYWQEDELLCYLLHLSQTMHDHVAFAAEIDGVDPYACLGAPALPATVDLQAIAASYPTLSSRRKIGQKEQTYLEWIKERMRAPESNKGALSFLLVEHLRHTHPTAQFSADELPVVLFAASVFKNLAAQFEMPQFAARGEEWIEKALKAHLKGALKNPLQRNQILNALTALLFQEYTFTGDWVENKGSYTAGRYTFYPEQFDLQTAGRQQNLLQGSLPKALKSHPALLQLFGSDPIYATAKRGKKNGEYHYTFEKGGSHYRIDTNMSTGEVFILREIDGIWARWFYNQNELIFASQSALNLLIEKKGIWVDINGRKGWIFTHLPQEKETGRILTCTLSSDGALTSIYDRESGKPLLTGHENGEGFEEQVPFWPHNHVLAFGDAVGKKASLFYLPATGALLSGSRLSSQAFDSDVEVVHNLPDTSREAQFLKTLGSLGKSIAIPVKDNKGALKIMLPPYAVHREKGSLKGAHVVADDSALGLAAPLLIGFNGAGKITGSPSAFLYLAYLYAQHKDYPRAYYYLEKAQKAPRLSAKEIAEVDRVSVLLHQMPAYSLRGSRFVLKSALTIHAIRRTHFGQVLYEDELSGAYFREVQFLTDVYRAYKQKIEQRQINDSNEEEMEALTKSEIDKLKRFESTSLRDFSDGYEPKKPDGLVRKIDAQKELPLLQIDPQSLKSPPIFVVQSLVAFAELDTPTPFPSIPRGHAPSAEVLIRYFLSFVEATQGPYKKTLAHYLLSEAQWQTTPPVTQEEARLAEVGEYLRQYLLLQFNTPSNVIGRIASANVIGRTASAIQEVRGILPTLPRPKMAPFSMLFTLIDVVITRRSFRVNSAIRTVSRILTNALPEEKLDPKSLLGSDIDVEIEKTEQTPSGPITTPSSILKTMQTRPHPYYVSLEKEVIIDLLEKEKAAHKDMDKEYSLFGVVEESQGRGYPVMGMRAFIENVKMICELENELAHRPTIPFTSAPLRFSSPAFETLTGPLKALLETASRLTKEEQAAFAQRKGQLERNVGIAKGYFPLGKEGIEEHENQQMRKGLEEGYDELLKELQERRIFSTKELEEFNKALIVQKGLIEAEYQTQRSALLSALKENNIKLPRAVRKMASMPDLYSDEELIERALHFYKNGHFKETSLDQRITEWLLVNTCLQQVEKAQASQDMSKAVPMLLALFDPRRMQISSLNRKCLVAENCDQVILRPKQREALLNIAQDPHRWCSVRMGIGKTSYIMPIIADLLVEMGYFPILTVPSRSLARNRDSIGRATRDFFWQEEFEFYMPTRQNLSYSTLSEIYLHMLHIKEAGGYIVTSPEHLACLNEQITLHQRELVKEIDFQKIMMQSFKIHYLQKIAQLIYGESRVGKTFFFGDEVDDTHHISNQINLAIGEKIPISMTIRETIQSFFELLIASEDPQVALLQTAIAQGGQAAILEKERDAALRAFAIEMKNSAFLKEKLKNLYSLVGMTSDAQWCQYLLNQTDQLPLGWPALGQTGIDPVFFETLGTLKTIFGTNARQLFGLQPGNDIGFSNYQGYIAVPKQLKNEIEGMRHGNEYELVFTQYLCYYQMLYSLGTTDETKRFLREELKKMKYEDPTAYAALEGAAAATHASDLLEYLLKPEAHRHRVGILQRVLDQGYINRFSQQIEMSVQDLYQGTEFGGVSGTMDPYTLPFISTSTLFSEGNGSTRQVEAETLLRLSMGHAQGLDTPITLGKGIYETGHDYLATLLANPATKAIINASGVTAEGKDTLQWAHELRKAHPERSYLFVHPKEQLLYLWTSDQAQPAPLRDRTIPVNSICIYAPSDTRGTDMPIGAGDVHLFLGPATTLQEMMQAIYRARQVGGAHIVYLHIAQQMALLIPHEKDKEITFGDVFNYIKQRTLQSKQSLNLKAQVRRITGQVKGAVLRYQRTPYDRLDDPSQYAVDKLQLIAPEFMARAKTFGVIETILIKNKKTDLSLAYMPQPKGQGVERVEAAFAETEQQIASLIQNLPFLRGPNEEVLSGALNHLLVEMRLQKSAFRVDREKHRPYLPTHVDIPQRGSDDSEGNQEQVIELQQEQALTQVNEIQQGPALHGKITGNLRNAFVSSKLDTSMADPEKAFTRISDLPVYLSKEARKIYDTIPLFTDPLFYIAVKDQTVAVICHYDYQELFLQKLPFKGKIYAPSYEGLREIYSDGDAILSTPDLEFKKLLARFCIADVSFTPVECEQFVTTYSTLSDPDKKALRDFALNKGGQFLRTFFKEHFERDST